MSFELIVRSVLKKWEEDKSGIKDNFGSWAVGLEEVKSNVIGTDYPEDMFIFVSGDVAYIADGGNGLVCVKIRQTVSDDLDSDGLTFWDEVYEYNTDPDNPDTDSDGLSDGEEVLTWGTNPLNRDTDGDVLLDGDEVHTYGTDPTNPDTDGDGIPDGVEIAGNQGHRAR